MKRPSLACVGTSLRQISGCAATATLLLAVSLPADAQTVPNGYVAATVFPVNNQIDIGLQSSPTVPPHITFSAPNMNESGDMVVRGVRAGRDTLVYFSHLDFPLGSTPSAPCAPSIPQALVTGVELASTIGSYSKYPPINAAGTIVVRRRANSGNKFVIRFDVTQGMNGTSSIGGVLTVARTSFAGASPPFLDIAERVALDDQGFVYFKGDFSSSEDIYRSDVDPYNPGLPSPIASTSSANLGSIGDYVAAAGAGPAVFPANALQLWTFDLSSMSVAAGISSGFVTIGSAPDINDQGVVAWYGSDPTAPSPQPSEGVHIRIGAEPRRLAGSMTLPPGAPVGTLPSSYDPSSNIAINELNQVAFVAMGPNPVTGLTSKGVYTTTLGAVRRHFGVGDSFQGSPITDVDIGPTVTRNGSVPVRIVTADGKQWAARTQRGLHQRKLFDEPLTPPDCTRLYLCNSVQGGCQNVTSSNASFTIGRVGCNLVTYANLLSYFGINVSVGEYQDWLLAKQLGGTKVISEYNDPLPGALERFTRERASLGSSSVIVSRERIHDNSVAGAMTNVAKIISEIRAGRPVKLRVPSRCSSPGSGSCLSTAVKRYGHFILAYGFRDPSRTDTAIMASIFDDLLVHDPGHGNVATLRDYDNLPAGAASFSTNGLLAFWLEDNCRIYSYDVTPASSPLPGSLNALSTSNVNYVLTDPNGLQAGTGVVASSVPGSSYAEEKTYDTIDEILPVVPAWPSNYSIAKRTLIPDPAVGAWTLQVTGTASGTFTVDLAATADNVPSVPRFSGSIVAGQMLTLNFEVKPAAQLSTPPTPPATGINYPLSLASPGDPGRGYILGISTGTSPGIVSGPHVVPLVLDPVLTSILNSTMPSTFMNFIGTLDANGNAAANVAVPASPSIVGLTVYTAFVVLDTSAPGGIASVSVATPLTIT